MNHSANRTPTLPPGPRGRRLRNYSQRLFRYPELMGKLQRKYGDIVGRGPHRWSLLDLATTMFLFGLAAVTQRFRIRPASVRPQKKESIGVGVGRFRVAVDPQETGRRAAAAHERSLLHE